MSGHWFDRLARTRAGSSQAGVGGSGELTRRDALARAGVATLSLGALGALGALPESASATPRSATWALDGQLEACGACNKASDKLANKAEKDIIVEFFKSVPTPAVGLGAFSWVFGMIGAEALRYSGLRKCADGVCNPQNYKPAPSATPAEEVETGAPICPPGTKDCGLSPTTGRPYCCFGDDACCNGTCCAAVVGCACASG